MFHAPLITTYSGHYIAAGNRWVEHGGGTRIGREGERVNGSTGKMIGRRVLFRCEDSANSVRCRIAFPLARVEQRVSLDFV